MKIVITGGHLSPALSVLEHLKNDTILMIGRKHTLEGDTNSSLEYKIAKEYNIPFKSISAGRLQRTFTRHTLPSLFKFPKGFFESQKIIKEFKPDVVLSFGGYVSFPVTISAFFQKVPVVIHEQTFGAGLANKVASFYAKKVCISWESSKSFFPTDKIVLTGNPVRKYQLYSRHPELVSGSDSQNEEMLKLVQHDKGIPLLYVTGGSSGSHTINKLVEGCLEKLLERFRVIHQTGDMSLFGDFEELEKTKSKLPESLQKRYFITKHVDPKDVGSILEKADIVVSRAGANTITELIYFGKTALLIPLNKEQQTNALFFKRLGLGEIFHQGTLSSEMLYEAILSMYDKKAEYTKNSKNARNMIQKDAAQKIIDVVYSVVPAYEKVKI